MVRWIHSMFAFIEFWILMLLRSIAPALTTRRSSAGTSTNCMSAIVLPCTW